MAYPLLPRWLSLLVVLALALAPAVQAAHAPCIAAAMGATAVSGDVAHSGCGGIKAGMVPGACAASCAVLLAVLPQPTAAPVLAAAHPVPAIVPATVGYIRSPDPHPPRPFA